MIQSFASTLYVLRYQLEQGEFRMKFHRLPGFFLLLGILVACNTGEPTPTPDIPLTVVALIKATISTATPAPTPTPQPTPTSQPMPTPQPTATPAPTPTPQSTPTPQPTATAQPRPTPQPTPTPVQLPALIALVPPPSGIASTSLGKSLTLQIEPGRPIAGRDIVFTLRGLQPWQRFTAEFVEPNGVSAEWVTENEATFAQINGKPVTKRDYWADAAGSAFLTRIATKDREGIWNMRLTVGEEVFSATYPVSQLQLEVRELKAAGVEFRRYDGLVTDSYYSSLVPASLALDLQGHLALVVERLSQILGLSSTSIPDLYLLGNENLLKQAGTSIGTDVTWEAGFYWRGAAGRGIYVRTDFFRSAAQMTVTHEYVHLLLDESFPNTTLPAWVNEGAATFYEVALGLESQRPDVVRRDIYTKADRVKVAAAKGTIFPLREIEDQRTWNKQTDKEKVSLQYSEAYMVIRYLIERFGEKALVSLLERLRMGDSLSAAIQSSTGVSYEQFEKNFLLGLTSWEDPLRLEVKTYVTEIDLVMKEVQSVSERRAQILQGAQAADYLPLVSKAQTLQIQISKIKPPSNMVETHSQVTNFMDKFVQWLTLELRYQESRDDSKHIAANGMIPEISARESMVLRAINSIEFNYRLP
ncbi:MAG: hypothetical protein HY666_00840 [Chloroflexi bacterium]|nr:hypothetical protein [Chloroflexota bacterium]